MDTVHAAAVPVAGLSAFQGLMKTGGMQPGSKVCICGGSGDVGSFAIQIAKAMGASEIWATGSSIEFIKNLGADKVINYTEESVFDALKG